MNCKKCGKEIVGEVKRYCNECKSDSIETRETEPSQKEKKSKKAPKEKEPKEKAPRSKVFTLGYVLLIFLVIVITFFLAYKIGFTIGPVLPI